MNDTATTYPPLFTSPRRVPQNGTWEGQIPTDQLWLYLNTIEIAHRHDDADVWGKLLWISESPTQGWDVWLGCHRECKLQSCSGDGTYEVRMIP